MRSFRKVSAALARGLTLPTKLARRLPLTAIAVVGAVTLAYHYSLGTLAGTLGLQTPLGYLALVPPIAVVLAWIAMRREGAQRPIHDRQLDYIIGLGLISVAAGVAFLLPPTLGPRFWLLRIDLLSLPIFAAGVVTLFYGLRTLWTLRFPIAFLFVAWPVPYLPLIGDGIRAFVDATSVALVALAHVIPVADAVPGEDTFFFIRHGEAVFPLSVTSACSGVNGLVGFILVGGALAYIVDGRLWRRLFWLAAGLVLIWMLNVLRIEAIFVVGALFGEHAAIEVLHPIAGLLFFNLGVIAMLFAVPRFGLRFVPLSGAPGVQRVRAVRPRRLRALVAAATVAMVLASLNSGYARFEPFADAIGQPRLAPFDVRQARITDWNTAFIAQYEQGKQFFGQSSTWDRQLYSTDAESPGSGLKSSVPIYVDVIDTDDASSFAAYGIDTCYQFHGYRIESESNVDVGAGGTAQVLDYFSPKEGLDWTALWWEWPYRSGSHTRYQRVVLLVANGPRASFEGGSTDVGASSAARFTETNRFVVALARALVSGHTQSARSQ